MLWGIQIGLGAIVAVICFHLVKARLLFVQSLGWLCAAYFVTRYVHGLFLSIRFIIGGEWLELVTALINVALLIWTIMYTAGGRSARLQALLESKETV